MSMYEMAQIIKMWDRSSLSVEQAIGQILLHIERLNQRFTALEQINATKSPASQGALPNREI